MLPNLSNVNVRADVTEIVNLWEDPKAKEYIRKRLDLLGASATEELIRQTETATQQRKQYQRQTLRFTIVLVLVWCFACAFVLVRFPQSPLASYLPASIPIPFIIAFFAFIGAPKVRAAKVLAEHEDSRGFGPLLMAASGSAASDVIVPALMKLLPRMEPSDLQFLSAPYKRALYQLLESGNAPLTLSVLAALEQAGDSSAIPYVQKLAASQPQSKENSNLQEAAQLCLSALHKRAEQEQTRLALLNASDNTIVASGPSHPAASTSPEVAQNLAQ